MAAIVSSWLVVERQCPTCGAERNSAYLGQGCMPSCRPGKADICCCDTPQAAAQARSVKSSVADPDPGSGAFLTPGSGMGRKSAFGSGIRDEQPGIRDEQPGSYFLELRNHFFGFFWVKILKFFDADPRWRQIGSGIRDGKKSDPG